MFHSCSGLKMFRFSLFFISFSNRDSLYIKCMVFLSGEISELHKVQTLHSQICVFKQKHQRLEETDNGSNSRSCTRDSLCAFLFIVFGEVYFVPMKNWRRVSAKFGSDSLDLDENTMQHKMISFLCRCCCFQTQN